MDGPLLRSLDDLRYWETLGAVAVPFVALGVMLTSRRLRDAGLSRWLVLLFFVPFANLLFFLVCALAPSRTPVTTVKLPAQPIYREGPQEIVLPATERSPATAAWMAGLLGAVIRTWRVRRLGRPPPSVRRCALAGSTEHLRICERCILRAPPAERTLQGRRPRHGDLERAHFRDRDPLRDRRPGLSDDGAAAHHRAGLPRRVRRLRGSEGAAVAHHDCHDRRGHLPLPAHPRRRAIESAPAAHASSRGDRHRGRCTARARVGSPRGGGGDGTSERAIFPGRRGLSASSHPRSRRTIVTRRGHGSPLRVQHRHRARDGGDVRSPRRS